MALTPPLAPAMPVWCVSAIGWSREDMRLVARWRENGMPTSEIAQLLERKVTEVNALVLLQDLAKRAQRDRLGYRTRLCRCGKLFASESIHQRVCRPCVLRS